MPIRDRRLAPPGSSTSRAAEGTSPARAGLRARARSRGPPPHGADGDGTRARGAACCTRRHTPERFSSLHRSTKLPDTSDENCNTVHRCAVQGQSGPNPPKSQLPFEAHARRIRLSTPRRALRGLRPSYTLGSDSHPSKCVVAPPYRRSVDHCPHGDLLHVVNTISIDHNSSSTIFDHLDHVICTVVIAVIGELLLACCRVMPPISVVQR